MSSAIEQMSGDCSSQEESEGTYHHGSSRGAFGLRGLGLIGGVVGAVGLVAVGAVVTLRGAWQPAAAAGPERGAAPLTVRALLEGDELTDLATDNLLALGGDKSGNSVGGRELVRGRVARGLKNVSEAIRSHYPEAHHKLDLLELTSAQKVASLRVLHKFGDPRMVGLANDIAEATHQAEQDGGDQDNFRRRLSEKLAPKLREVQQLSQEMFPGQAFNLDASAAMPQFRKWNPSVEVDLSSRRLLSEMSDFSVEQGVQAHAHTLFKSLQTELGDQMPSAPARLLTTSSSDDKGDVSFMACCMKAMPSPPKVVKCMVDNMSEVMSMLGSFVKGKA